MKAQGLDADGNPLPAQQQEQQQVFANQPPQGSSGPSYADWSKEAAQRGAWSGFKKPKDKVDRLRAGVPWKFRTRGSLWGDVRLFYTYNVSKDADKYAL